ncbi:HD-GYP domain-containing protein [Paenibacillus zeisoli]|uniref:HD-GYP domain-containing protein n=1 Tax=Paenibacillus zeisoli TaxID=2496267 RepID=A0A3S1D7L2_9BACL|nr:HD-GYP domain-containing protein [Paenibacillus zeisoli]RUT29505.1 HD-GYP domain-containing protein [Paenibacillus zeisoli]
MRRHVMELAPGDRIENDIFNNNGVFVLKKGTILTDESIVKLVQHSIDYVDVELSVAEEPPLRNIEKMELQFNDAIDAFESIFLESLTTGKFDENDVDDLLNPLLRDLTSQKDVVSLLLLLDKKDNYTYNHSMQVGMLSYYIALWLDYPHEMAYKAGKAGFLHDIGKSMISPEILNKPGKLTPEEYEEIKRHTIYGSEIIRNSTKDEISALVALQHHEREDGTGYPNGLTSSEIHPFAKITAIADVYSAMTSNRVYQNKQELITVLHELYRLSFGKFSAEPTQAFIRHMLPNFIGKRVRLSSGELGSIVMTNPSDFFRPLVKTDTRFADLSREMNIDIQEVFME